MRIKSHATGTHFRENLHWEVFKKSRNFISTDMKSENKICRCLSQTAAKLYCASNVCQIKSSHFNGFRGAGLVPYCELLRSYIDLMLKKFQQINSHVYRRVLITMQ
jgi:hypothetical protein